MPNLMQDAIAIPLIFKQAAILADAAAIARDLDLRLYLVGGVVRDALTAQQRGDRTPMSFTDLDLVVEGGEDAGLRVARRLHKHYPEAKLQTFARFQTADLHWEDFTVDVATARRETYASPGANPEVQATTLLQDLHRRDFTVNAMALELREVAPGATCIAGPLIDLFGGRGDLDRRLVRAIRPGSFTEDPRRIFRAVRFAVRLGFAIAPETEAEIRACTASGIHDAIAGSRLRAELEYIAASPQAAVMLKQLGELGALRCIHPDLELPPEFAHHWRRLRWGGRLLAKSAEKRLDLPRLGPTLLLSYLDPAIAMHINLGTSDRQRLESLPSLLHQLERPPTRPSELAERLDRCDIATLLLAGIRATRPQRRLLWQYCTHWRHVKPWLSGQDLQALGCPPGKAIGKLLQALKAAMLDGEVRDRDGAVEFVRASLRSL